VNVTTSERGTWKAQIINLESRLFCGSCNSGWMSQLENETKPVVEPMIHALDRVRLDEGAQLTLARWAHKTALALFAWNDPTRLPADLYRLFWHHGVPRGGVWISACNDRPENVGRYSVVGAAITPPGQPPAKTNWYQADFTLGHIAFRVGEWIGDEDAHVSDHRIWHAWPRIWPVNQAIVEWPPRRVLSAEDLDTLFESLTPPSS
jgi:hypothetical protein